MGWLAGLAARIRGSELMLGRLEPAGEVGLESGGKRSPVVWSLGDFLWWEGALLCPLDLCWS